LRLAESYQKALLSKKKNGFSDPEKSCCRSTSEGAVLDLGLLGQVLCRLNGRVHALHREESGQVGSVRRNHDQGEEPPHAGDHARGNGSVKIRY